MPLSAILPGYAWDSGVRRYRRRGRFVPEFHVRSLLDGFLDGGASHLRSLSERLRDGKLDLAGWQIGFERELKSLHLAAKAAALGGWKQLDASALGSVGATLRGEYGYLDQFARAIDRGDVDLTTTGFLARSEGYAGAARIGTYEGTRREQERAAGVRWERRLLGKSEHCPDCVDDAAAGWQAFGEGLPMGQGVCGQWCMCVKEYSDSETVPDEGAAAMSGNTVSVACEFDPASTVEITADFAADSGGQWVTVTSDFAEDQIDA